MKLDLSALRVPAVAGNGNRPTTQPGTAKAFSIQGVAGTVPDVPGVPARKHSQHDASEALADTLAARLVSFASTQGWIRRGEGGALAIDLDRASRNPVFAVEWPRLAAAANALLAPATPSAPQRYAVALEYRITPAHGHSGVVLDPDGPVSAVLAIDAVQGPHVDWEALGAKLATRAQQAEKEGRTEAAKAEREASRLCSVLQARYGATNSQRKAAQDRPSRRR